MGPVSKNKDACTLSRNLIKCVYNASEESDSGYVSGCDGQLLPRLVSLVISVMFAQIS